MQARLTMRRVWAAAFCILSCDAFTVAPTSSTIVVSSSRRVSRRAPFFATADPAGDEEGAPKALVAATPEAPSDGTQSLEAVGTETQSDALDVDRIVNSSSVAFMITREMKRAMIEELGYRRRDVDILRPELAGPIVEKRLRCPPDGIPQDWLLPEEDRMLEKLKEESKYPLKFPLLGVSLILFGKGFSDAAITLIKFNMGGYGVTLSEAFLGVPVLAIDALCVVLGAALGVWTLKTMRDR